MKKKRKILIDKHEKYGEIGEMYSSKGRTLNLTVPSDLRMLCAILDVKIEDILSSFMWMLSYSVHNKGTEKKRSAARKFFMSCNFGRHQYSKGQIKQMFDELHALRKIVDTTDKMATEDRELFWKNSNMYGEYWYQSWYNRNKRQDDISVLKNH